MEDAEKQVSPDEKKPQEETPPPEESVDTLKAQLEEEKKLREQAEKGLKTARSTITDKQNELDKYKDIHSSIKEIKAELGVHRAFIDEVGYQGTVEDDEDEPKSKGKRPSLDEKMREIEQNAKQEQYRTMAQEAEGIARSIGLDIASAPECEVVRNYFRSGDPGLAREGVKLLQKMQADKEETPPQEEPKVDEQPKETEAEMRERIKREILEEQGALTPEGSLALSGGLAGMSKEDIKAKMSDRAWFREHEAEIDAAYRSGALH